MKKILAVSLAALALTSSPVLAEIALRQRAVSYPSPSTGCMTENAQVTINFSGVETDAAVIKPKFDAKVAEIEKIFKEAALDKFEVQSMNYSISPQNYGNNMNATFQFSGNIGYTVLPASKATALMAELTSKGYQTSVNVSSYRNGTPCPTVTKQ